MFTVLSPTAFQAGGVTGTPGASVPGRGVGRFVGGSLLREQSGNISTVRSPGRLREDQLRVPARWGPATRSAPPDLAAVAVVPGASVTAEPGSCWPFEEP